ncbi:winged helix-turn-helix domain-containing protein, partial [Rhizobium ruizarguesonis]
IRKLSQVPVLMLTARGDDVDRISGLNLGADDYVPKPCSPGELAARLRAILRRAGQPAAGATTDTIRAGKLVIHPSSRIAEWRGESLELTGTEFSLIEVLARSAGQLVSKQDISKRAFGKPLTPFDRRIDVHISSVRQKLGLREDGQSWIQSVRGQGYQLLVD